MDPLERFRGTYEEGMRDIENRRSSLIDWAEEHKPESLEELAKASYEEEDYCIRLAWVKIPDPRPQRVEMPVEIEVMPKLGVSWLNPELEDSKMGIGSLHIVGRLPSGEEQNIYTMIVPTEHKKESLLFVETPNSGRATLISWDSADAELFLNVAEAALEQQPLGQ